MKRLLLTLGAICGLIALPASLPAQNYEVQRAPLATAFDLDGEAADNDQVVVAATFADSTTFTIAAQPDACRLIDATVVDADASISAGTVTVTGTDCWGQPLKATFLATGGSGTRTLTVIAFDSASVVKASGAYFLSITSVISGVLTGEGGAGDTLAVGYTANSDKTWPMYGKEARTPTGRRYVNIWDGYDVRCLIKNGAATTDVVGVTAASTACFENVSVGDLLYLNISGETLVRRVASRADADTITIDVGATIPSAGVNFYYRKKYVLADPIDGWISVGGFKNLAFIIDVVANANTGGVVTSVQCASALSGDLPNGEVVDEVDTDTVASGSADTFVTSVVLSELPAYTHCRASIKFGTGDDTDTAAEDINMTVALSK